MAPHTPAAPIDADSLDAVLQPFGRSRTLPAAAYTAQEIFEWELRHLFAGTWTCVGRADPVRQRALTVGGIGVLLTCEEGKVRAFANVCRHRGHELLPEGGTADRVAVV